MATTQDMTKNLQFNMNKIMMALLLLKETYNNQN